MTGFAERVRERTAHALACGALEPIATRIEEVADGGVRFVVRVVEALARKPRILAARPGLPPGANPFLPWDDDLFVADVSATHVALLNKFPAIEGHVLLVTRSFEPQESALDAADFEALARCMAETGGLGFYNGGAVAGASQRHKHLQLVTRPLGLGPEPAPLAPLLAEAAAAGRRSVAALPWRHRVVPTGDLAAAAPRYRALLDELDVHPPTDAYNLLVTREWLCVVPRTRGAFDSISVNALGFAGALLARDGVELERIRAVGPLAVLRAVAPAPDAR